MDSGFSEEKIHWEMIQVSQGEGFRILRENGIIILMENYSGLTETTIHIPRDKDSVCGHDFGREHDLNC